MSNASPINNGVVSNSFDRKGLPNSATFTMQQLLKPRTLFNRLSRKLMESAPTHFEFSYKTRVTESLQVRPGDSLKQVEELRQQTNGNKVIGTHSEVFHCDEVVATTVLLYTNEFKDANIIRTRNQEVLDTLDIVCDVGSVFDATKYRFDHHQRTFNMAWSEDENQPIDETLAVQPFKIKLSSAGLIWKYFGKEVLAKILAESFPGVASTYNENDLEKMYQKLYKNFFQEIDALDNGVKIATEERYWINTNLGTRISRFNKAWNAPPEMDQNNQFKRAMRVVEEELHWHIYSVAQVFMPARKQVEEAWEKRREFHESGEFMYIENSCPWKEHLSNIESENNLEGLIKFVFFKDQRGMHRIQTVPPTKGSGFDMRVPLAKAWRGLRAEDLKKITPYPDMEFVHHSGFIGGAWSLDTCLKMGADSLKEFAEQAEQKQAEAPAKQEASE